ncbi:MAG: Si-specific NAD(P)(+) transhydrogenase [Oligoflexia bacterium]|nr:Si-specific NAD(P)(+) transhydrogenase [Oligoflexia bacterium]
MKSFDLIVIGSGPSGHKGAIQAAKFGKRVALIEKEKVFGGACIHTGTLPSKSLRESIYNIYMLRLSDESWTRKKIRKEMTLEDLTARKNRVVNNENEIISHQIRTNGISVYHGAAQFIDRNSVKVVTQEGGEITLKSEHFLIATGSKPVRPSNIPFDDIHVCDSDSILGLKSIPESMTVIGGGVIGCEYASMFAALGVDLHLVDKKSDILPFMDQEVTEVLKKALIDQGCRLYLGDECTKISKNAKGLITTELKSGKIIETTHLLYAMGRAPQSPALKVKELGIKTDERGYIDVKKNYQTAVDNIYAVGDVIGFPSLASSGFEQGRLAVCHAFDIPHGDFPDEFPYGIYTIPEISSVGLTEEEIAQKKIPYEVGRAEYAETARGQIILDSNGLLKIIFCPETLKIYGIHIIGPSASELVHLGQMVMSLGGNMKTLIRNIFNYPTLAEAYKIAAFNGLNKVFKKGGIHF